MPKLLQTYADILENIAVKETFRFQGETKVMVGMGYPEKKETFLLFTEVDEETVTPIHVALRAPSREKVDACHAAALKAGLKDNGAPGIRAHYHSNYYAAFVIDEAGHNLEFVTHLPE